MKSFLNCYYIDDIPSVLSYLGNYQDGKMYQSMNMVFSVLSVFLLLSWYNIVLKMSIPVIMLEQMVHDQ